MFYARQSGGGTLSIFMCYGMNFEYTKPINQKQEVVYSVLQSLNKPVLSGQARSLLQYSLSVCLCTCVSGPAKCMGAYNTRWVRRHATPGEFHVLRSLLRLF